MSTSVFIARLIGPVMLVIGLAVLANQSAFRDMAEEFLASRALLFLSGLLRLCAPAYVMQTGRTMLKRPHFITAAAAIWVVAGSLFCLFGLLH